MRREASTKFKTLCVIICLSCCALSLTQATNLKSKSKNAEEIRLHRRQSAFDTFQENCPAGQVLTDILLASPTDECRTAFLGIASIESSDFITNAETVLGYLQTICEENCRNYVYSTLLRCLPSYVPILPLACSSNAAQIQCWQAIAVNDGTAVVLNCYAGSLSGMGSGTEMHTQCAPECRNALTTLRSEIGCCVSNAFNTTTFGLLELGIADYGLWSSCEVETTSLCPEPNFINIFQEDTTTDSYALRVGSSLCMLVLSVVIAMLLF